MAVLFPWILVRVGGRYSIYTVHNFPIISALKLFIVFIVINFIIITVIIISATTWQVFFFEIERDVYAYVAYVIDAMISSHTAHVADNVGIQFRHVGA